MTEHGAALPQGDASPERSIEADPRVAALRWFAQEQGHAFSEAGLFARLPADARLSDPHVFGRALSILGFQSLRQARRPKQLDPAVLPCLLVSKDGDPLILTTLDRSAGVARLIDPTAPGQVEEVSLRALAKRVRGEVTFITAGERLTTARLDPSSARKVRRRSHWLWGPVLSNWPAWAQVVLVASCLNLLHLALPIFVMNVYDRVIPNLAFVTLWTLALGVAIALGLELVLRLLRMSVLELITARVDLSTGRHLFAHAMNLTLLGRRGGAAGVANLIRDFDQVRDFFSSATFVAFVDFLFIGLFAWVLWWLVGPIALVPLGAAIIVIVIAALSQIPLGARILQLQGLAAKRHTVLIETLSGIETVKSVGAEPVMQREWERTTAATTRLGAITRFWAGLAQNSAMMVQQGTSVVIIVWGVYLLAQGEITVGALIAANMLSGRVLAPLGSITQTILKAQNAAKTLTALSGFNTWEREASPTVTRQARVRSGEVRFEGVSFTFPDTERPALAELDLEIGQGEIVAILGRVGSGKSTFGKLVAGLLSADEGSVCIGGVAIEQYDKADLREGVGYLPQSPDVFTGTVRENLTLGAPRAQDEALLAALDACGMGPTLSALPDGLDTFLGERGERLSGGQRQALSLARLMLRKPKILFLDEPTNMMDQTMEARIIERLTQASEQGTTVLLATHRQTLAQRASRYVILDRGRKAMDGPRDQVVSVLSRSAQSGTGGA
ncbi:MAG: ATP-binding cassette domain-containing protein [Pseudomonadota bacterium]